MQKSDRQNLDAIDLKLVKLLLGNARLSFKVLSAEVGLTGPACAERVRRLQERGVVTGFHAEVSWSKLGFPISAIVRVAAGAEMGTRLIQQFVKSPNVVEVQRVTGVDSYVVHVLAESSADLEKIIDAIGTIGVVTTSMVLSTPLPASSRLAEMIKP